MRAKKAVACLLWISGTPMSEIEEVLTRFGGRFDGAAGPMRSVRSRTADVLPTVAMVAQLLHSGLDLTQRRRSEGRGNEFTMRSDPMPRWAKVCEICGAERVKNRYCKSCAVEVARENMAQVALIGHSKPKTARVRARISQTLSDHAVANSWWLPSSLPAWLNEKFYVQKIQPELGRFNVRQIAEALQVSQPYAAFIRSGRRRPHRRHWQTLAKLAGVSADLLNA
jgi:hypothetical protein